MRKNSLLIWIFLTGAFLQAQDMLFYEEAVQLALQNNHDIQIAASDRRVSANNFTRGNAGFLPSILWSGSRNYSTQNVKQSFITGSENKRDKASSNTWNTGIELRWTLFDGTKMFASYDKLGALNQLGDQELKIAVENTIYNTTLAYYNIILEKNRLIALDSTLLLSESRKELAKINFELGKAPKFEFLSAEIDYNSDFTLLLNQREALALAKYQLNELLAREIKMNFEVPTSLHIDTSFVLEELKQIALVQNSAILEASTTGRIIALEIKERKSERWPSLDLNVGYNYSNLSSEAGFLLSNRVHGLNYGVSASWWLFDGNKNKLERQNLQVEQESHALQVEQLKLRIIKELEDNFLSYSNNLKFIKLDQHNLALALENAQMALDRYKLGKSGFIEFREAQVNVVKAYSQLFNTVYETKIAELNMLLLSGQVLINE